MSSSDSYPYQRIRNKISPFLVYRCLRPFFHPLGYDGVFYELLRFIFAFLSLVLGCSILCCLVIFSCVVGLFGCRKLALHVFKVGGFCCKFSVDWQLLRSKGLVNFLLRLRLWCEYRSRPGDILNRTIGSFDENLVLVRLGYQERAFCDRR